MENILNLLEKYQSLILIGLGVIILVVVLIRTKKQKTTDTDNTINIPNIFKKKSQGMQVRTDHLTGKTSITIGGKEYDDIEKIKDRKLREKARKMMKFTKNTKNFIDLK